MYTTTHSRQAPWRRSDVGDVHGHRRKDGCRKPRKVIWIIHAGTMVKDAPEHLMYYSSERVRQLANLGQVQNCLGLTKAQMNGCKKGPYDNLSRDVTPDEDAAYDWSRGS